MSKNCEAFANGQALSGLPSRDHQRARTRRESGKKREEKKRKAEKGIGKKTKERKTHKYKIPHPKGREDEQKNMLSGRPARTANPKYSLLLCETRCRIWLL